VKPGPVAHPFRRLADAAILYAEALEAEDVQSAIKRQADRLRKAALRYQSTPRPRGRPRKA
jgi:hypothetical protein